MSIKPTITPPKIDGAHEVIVGREHVFRVDTELVPSELGRTNVVLLWILQPELTLHADSSAVEIASTLADVANMVSYEAPASASAVEAVQSNIPASLVIPHSVALRVALVLSLIHI